MPQPEFIDETDIAIVYNQAKNGLVDLVVRSLEQARLFKVQIESFQRALLQEEATHLRSEQTQLNQSIRRIVGARPAAQQIQASASGYHNKQIAIPSKTMPKNPS